jgi:hypothetical protein
MLHFLRLALAGIFLFGHPAFRLIRNLQEIDRLCHANDGDVTLLASSIRQWETGYLETISRHLFSTCLSPSLDAFALRTVAHLLPRLNKLPTRPLHRSKEGLTAPYRRALLQGVFGQVLVMPLCGMWWMDELQVAITGVR